MTVDSGGAVFPTTQTAWMGIEVPDDYVAAQLVFANVGTASYGIADAAIASSSQLGSTNFATSGITPYDQNGNAINTLTRVTFAAQGANTDPFVTQQQLAGSICTTVASGSTTTAINVASTTGVTANMVVMSPVASPVNYLPQTYVASVGTGVVNLATAAQAVPATGSQICFQPIAATIPAAAFPPIPSYYRSDWMPVSSYTRIDSPVKTGGLVQGNAGIATGTTVAAFNGTWVTLSAPTTAAIPGNSSVEFCTAFTTTSATTPVNTVSFSSVPPAVVAGMYISQGFAPELNLTASGGFPSAIKVASVSGNTVTLSDYVEQGVPNGAAFVAYVPMTVAANAAAGATTLSVNSVPPNVASGMWIMGTGIPGSNGPMTGNNATISSISGNTLTLSAGLNGNVNAGDVVYAGVNLTVSANVSAPGTNYSQQLGIYPGMHVTGAAMIRPNTYTGQPGGTSMTLTRTPTSVIPSGTTLQACDPLKTTAPVAAGSTTLPISTVYPKKLFLVRLNFATAGVNYPFNGGFYNMQVEATLPGMYGDGRIQSGLCGGGNDGVLNPTSISNTGGQCAPNHNLPVAAIKFLTAKRGVEILTIGDSHFGGDTTVGSASNAELQTAAAMTTPQLPVWSANCGYSGQSSYTFLSSCYALIKEVQPSVVMIPGFTFNDLGTAAGTALFRNNMAALTTTVLGYGGLPVISTEYERQVYGCNSTTSYGLASNETFRQQLEAFQTQNAAANSLPILDNAAILQDPAHPNFLNPAYSTDCIHANDAGQAARANAEINLLRPYLAN